MIVEKRRNKKTIFLILTSIFLVIALFVGFFVYRTFVFSQTVFKQESLKDDIISFIPVINNTYNSDVDRYIKQGKDINILLLGYGGAGHDGEYLTDSMMVVNINTSLKKVTLISIPRDMWVPIPSEQGYSPDGKINSAFAIGMDGVNYQNRPDVYKGKYGGGNISKDVVSSTLGIPITYFASIDFNGFSQIVDSLGGVTINVDNTFDDYEYPSSDANSDGPLCSAPMNTPTTCRYYHLHFDQGVQQMNGQIALEYARSRHAYGIEGSDFARAKRQQKLIVAIKDKALQLGSMPKIFSIMNSIQNNIMTDMTLTDMKDLITNVQGWNLSTIYKGALTSENGLTSTYSSDGQYILIPTTGLDNFKSVQDYVQTTLNQAYITSENAKIEIENEISNQNALEILTTDLNNIGINPITTQSPTLSTQTVIYDFTNGKDPKTLSAVEALTGGTLATQNTIPNPQNASIIVTLGSNYKYSH